MDCDKLVENQYHEDGQHLYSAPSTEYELGSGTFARPPPLGPNWKGNWEPRASEIKGWLKDWPLKDLTGHHDEQLRDALAQLGSSMTKKVKDCVHWAYSQENHGTWFEETVEGLLIQTPNQMFSVQAHFGKLGT